MTSSRLPIGVFHPGTQHSWQTARSLQDCGDLAWYATSIFWVKDRLPYSLVPYLPVRPRERVMGELRRFYHPDLDPARVRVFGGLEWAMRVAGRAGWRSAARWLLARSAESFAQPVGRLIRAEPVRAVWGYDLSSLEVFQGLRSSGVKKILDRTIGHPAAYNALMDEVYEQFSEFFTSPNYRIGNDIIDRSDQEHEEADVILVGSAFCGQTLNAAGRRVDMSKVRTVPYCFDNVFFKGGKVRQRKLGEPVRFLFTGQAGPRKGIHLVLKVFEQIPKSAATLTIIGSLDVPASVFARYADRVVHYPTVPRPDVARFMREADFLVFPSYFEGAALSVYEATSMGLGIIQSSHTDIIFPDSELLMKEITEEELYRCVMTAIEKREILEKMSAAGLEISKNFSYEAYRDRVSAVVNDL